MIHYTVYSGTLYETQKEKLQGHIGSHLSKVIETSAHPEGSGLCRNHKQPTTNDSLQTMKPLPQSRSSGDLPGTSSKEVVRQ